MVKHMSVEPINKEDAVGTSVDLTHLNGSTGPLTPAAPGWLGKDNPNYLLNLFTVLLLASALIIMVVVGAAIDRIYSAAMVKNTQESAISVVNLLMNTELDNLIKPGPNGQLILVVDPSDMHAEAGHADASLPKTIQHAQDQDVHARQEDHLLHRRNLDRQDRQGQSDS